jgi:soluble lytic murein transglycosylase
MFRLFGCLGKLIAVLALAALAAAGIVLWHSADSLYTIQEWLNYSRFSRYDKIIAEVGKKRQIDPMLIKAIIWRESSFHPDKVGKNGERGLMQVTVAAAKEWAKAERQADFVESDLFKPRTNIEAGTWYLKQALQRWSTKDDALPFALAEYNAGRSRVNQWIDQTNMGEKTSANDLRESIPYRSTRAYIDTILKRYNLYKQRGYL